MADKAEQLILDIHAALADLTGTAQVRNTHYGIGKLDRDRHRDAAYVSWLEEGGAIEPLERHKDSVATDVARYTVSIWNTSRELCRTAMHNLILATRKAAYARNAQWGSYEWGQDAHNHKGFRLNVDIAFRIPVPVEPTIIVQPTDQTHTVTMAGLDCEHG